MIVYIKQMPNDYRLSVKAMLDPYRGVVVRDLGEIGTAETDQKAIELFGSPEFKPDGIHIGNYHLPRAKLIAP